MYRKSQNLQKIITTFQKGTYIQARSAKLAPLNVKESKNFVAQAEHVVAEVKRQLLNDPEFAILGNTKEERKKAVFGCPSDDTACFGGGGLKVYVTLNLSLQQHANEVLNTWDMLNHHTGVLLQPYTLSCDEQLFSILIEDE